jgi:hypothetical protein
MYPAQAALISLLTMLFLLEHAPSACFLVCIMCGALMAVILTFMTLGPRLRWETPPLSDDALRLFPARCCGKSGISSFALEEASDALEEFTLGDGLGFDRKKHVVPHGSYLVNLANPDPQKRQQSYNAFVEELKVVSDLVCHALGKKAYECICGKRAEVLGIGLFNFQ